ncbi:hypothetical protein [Streptomyces longispororuber]|uniref:hypothetical protein n=1 Tax=Streptomyces longispororuber TaxID=68230 RepID=UPI00210EFFFA|nr:hypothetical protein [Streptomyces longispororuber]MCQ4213798.1 hypothetical protein [Streptomyces longispororuber]
MNDALIAAILSAVGGVLITAIVAAIKAALNSRAVINESLRNLRLEKYPEVWRATSHLSRWPRPRLTDHELQEFHTSLQSWYYEKGGLYLSYSARDRYDEMQQSLEAWLEGGRRPATTPVPADVYDRLLGVCSSLRTALTEDLETRRARSMIRALERTRNHRIQAKKAATFIETLTKKTKELPTAD